VLFLTAEDGIADTIRPRLDVMGGDPSRMAVLEAIREPDGSRRTLSLVRDLDMLAQAIREVDPVLVGIDPLSAYLGQVDTHRDGEVRSALAPLLALIAERRCALAAIAHLSKDAQRAALHRPGGSIAFVAAARLVLAVAADPNDPERRLLAPLKGNLGKPAPVLAYRITDRGALAWEAAPVTGTDVEVLFRPTSPGDLEERTDAETVIRELIAETAIWPIDAKEAIAFGQGHGIHERTLQRAARRLGLRVERQGFGRGGRWFWHRPPIDDIPDTISPEHPDVSSMAPMEKPSEIDVNNNIDDTKSAFARAREAGAITDADGIF
jgi:hypothetical protein